MLTEEMKKFQSNEAAVILDDDRHAHSQADLKKKKASPAID